jgi:hypothetical protein
VGAAAVGTAVAVVAVVVSGVGGTAFGAPAAPPPHATNKKPHAPQAIPRMKAIVAHRPRAPIC